MRKILFQTWSQNVEWYISNFTGHDFGKKEDGLPYLRNRLFVSVLLILFPICALVYLPSVFIAFKTRLYIIGISDTLAMGVLCFIFFAGRSSLLLRKRLMSVTFYLLSIVLLVIMGVKGPAMFIMLCISVLISLYQSKKAGLIAVGINTLIFLFYLAASPVDLLDLHFFREYELIGWLGVNANLFAFNLIVVFAATTLVNQLNESWVKEVQLQSALSAEREELIIAKQKAEESDRLKTAFLANMSHEIRTPMNGLLGFAELLRDPELNSDDQQQYLTVVRKSTTRMLTLINNIIDISRIESGSVDIVLKKTNVNKIMDQVCKLLKPDAETKQLLLSLACSFSGDHIFVITDEQKFTAILTNLVRNAIKYTKAGSVEVGCNLVVSENTGKPLLQPELRFYVKDTGIGIPEDRQKVIFERFRQAEIEDKQAMEGAGLGLSIAASYVGMLGGSICVDSTPGKGTTFHFTLPYRTN